MRKLTHDEILHRQKEKQAEGKVPLVVVLNNIRSLYNVGAIFRTADGAGVQKIWITGITGHPPNNMISKTALGAEESVNWEYNPDIFNVVKQLKKEGYEIAFLEHIESSIPYQAYSPNKPVAIILGNEIDGISDSLLAECDQAIEIEMAGLKNSLNVSVAFGIVAYHLRNQLLKVSAS